MPFAGFPKSGLAFFRELAAHNNRDWFEAHRAAWDGEIVPAMIVLCAALKARLADVLPGLQLVPRVGGSVQRLTRDIRFSRDKSPHHLHAAALLWEGEDKNASPAIYLAISPEQVLVSGGIWIFEEGQLDRFRKRLVSGEPATRLDEALAAAAKEGLAPGAQEKLPRPPRGIPAEHPRAELGKHKGLVVTKAMKPQAWLHTEEAVDKLATAARAYAPLHAWLRTELIG